MSDQPAPASRGNPVLRGTGRGIEAVVLYLSLVVAPAVLFLKFLRSLWEFILHAPGARSADRPGSARPVDISLVANSS